MDLQVDLLLVRAPSSPREIYAVARGLEALAPTTPFAAIRRTLEAGQGPLLSGISEEVARQAEELLAAHGAEGRAVPHSAARANVADATAPVRYAAGRQVPAFWPALAGIALVTLIAWWWWASRREPVVGAPAPALESAANDAPVSTSPLLDPRQVGSLGEASTASIRCADSLGSGFFVAPDRLLTNAHVLCEGGGRVEVVLSDGRKLTGNAEREDRWLDVALVKVDGAREPALRLGDASSLRQGDQLFFYGSPHGLDFTLSQALLSRATRTLRGLAYLQLDGNVNPGNSGGPLLTPRGEVVGIVTATIGENSGLGLALPVNYLYEGKQPLVDRPAGIDLAAWKRITGAAAAEDEREVTATRESMRSAGLAAVLLTSDFNVVAMVARHSALEPYAERFSFRVVSGRETLCSPAGDASRWGRAGSTSEAPIDERTRQWLQRNHLDSEVWVAGVLLDWMGCPPPQDSLGLEVVFSPPGGEESRAAVTFAPGI